MPRKYDTAHATSHAGLGPATFNAIWDQIPDNLKERLTGAELAQVADAMLASHQRGKHTGQQEAVRDWDGAVWGSKAWYSLFGGEYQGPGNG